MSERIHLEMEKRFYVILFYSKYSGIDDEQSARRLSDKHFVKRLLLDGLQDLMERQVDQFFHVTDAVSFGSVNSYTLFKVRKIN